jgi:predicted Zn-ribbon and HTH transcriptional regulator
MEIHENQILDLLIEVKERVDVTHTIVNEIKFNQLNEINEHLKKINGRLNRHDDEILLIEKRNLERQYHCPFTEKLQMEINEIKLSEITKVAKRTVWNKIGHGVSIVIGAVITILGSIIWHLLVK